ncbi:MAG: hypothetical protein ACLP0H_05250 [Terriglobales bacterium]
MSQEGKLFSTLNLILDLLTLGATNLPLKGEPLRTFGLDRDGMLSVKGPDVQKFNSAVDALLDVIPGARGSLSPRTLEDQLIPEIRGRKTAGLRFTEAEAESFKQKVLAVPLERYRVLRPIYGVTMPEGAAPATIGIFTIYDAVRHSNLLALSEFVSAPRLAKQSGFLIECSVDARDNTKAVEVADALFYRFELLLRFFIGQRTRRFEVGILSYVGPQLRDYVAIGSGGSVEGSAWQGALEPISITDPFFCNPGPPFERLLRLISRQSNQLEARAVRCMEWTAQSMADLNAASAFVKAAIALEVLFSGNEKGVITPSITAQIAESCAFLLGDSAAAGYELERAVRHLYGIRSAVVHSGRDSVAEKDLNQLIQICRRSVLKLLSRKELEGVHSIEALTEHLKKGKYSSLEPSKTE